MIESASWDEGGVVFQIGNRVHRRLTALDLWECAPFQFDPLTGQRTAEALAQPEQLAVKSVAETATGWSIVLEPFGTIDLGPQDIEPYLHPRAAEAERRPWDTPDQGWEVFDYQAFLDDDDTRRRCLLQVARYGVARLVGAPLRMGEVERFIAAFGHVRETNYGRVFDVRVKKDAANLADTDRGLAPHTDNPYRTPVPRLQVLHWLAASDEGGETRVVDGLAAALQLRASRPEAFDLLRRTPVRFAWHDSDTELSACEPLLSVDDWGRITAIRLNHRSYKAIDAEPEVRDAWRDAHRALLGIINDLAFGDSFRLSAGEVLFFDNHRILHGRTAYSSSGGGERHLQGAYAEGDGLYSTLRVLTDAETDRRLRSIAAVFEAEATLGSYGETLSIRDHMLQSADLAVEHGLDEPTIAACLLHDIGWALPGGKHEASAADFLAPLLGPAVAEPIRLHVEAKRYLVAREAGYFDKLSDASRRTLVQQGGPMAPDACDSFERTPGFAEAVALRRLDDEAKDTDRPARPFDAFAGLLERVIGSQLL